MVLHSISLPPGQYGGDGIRRLFTNTLDWSAHPYFETIRGLEVSAHFVVRRDGEVLQFVSIDKRAWHAGRLGLVTGNARPANDWSIGIELEGLEGDTFEPAQYAALQRLLPAHRPLRGIRHVVGHEHVAPGRKFDPGPGFDWHELAARLRWDAARIPPAQAAAGLDAGASRANIHAGLDPRDDAQRRASMRVLEVHASQPARAGREASKRSTATACHQDFVKSSITLRVVPKRFFDETYSVAPA